MNFLKTTPGIRHRKSINKFDDGDSIMSFNNNEDTNANNYNNIKTNHDSETTKKKDESDSAFFQVVFHKSNKNSNTNTNNFLTKSTHEGLNLPKKGPVIPLQPTSGEFDFFVRKSHNSNKNNNDDTNLDKLRESENEECQSSHFLKANTNKIHRSHDLRRSSRTKLDVNNMTLRGIFQYENVSIDLEVSNEILKFSPISDKTKIKQSEFYVGSFYSVEPVYLKTANNKKKSLNNNHSEDSIENQAMNGIKLHMFENDKPNLFKYKSFTFNHPHTKTCKEFIQKLTENIPNLKSEKEVLVLLNPYSGEKKTRFILNHTVAPILNTAKIKYQVIEFHDHSPLGNSLITNKININNYHGIVIMGGDSSIARAINIIIDLEVQRQENLNLFKLNDIKKKLRTPFCFVPCGSTNMIVLSIYGVTDFGTPLRYLIHDIKIRVDMSAVFTGNDKLQSLGFNYACGFGATMMRYFKRYEKLGNNKVPTSLTRGVMKNKQKAIEIEIKYLKCKNHQPFDENLCVKGCKICNSNMSDLKSDKIFDLVEDFSISKQNKNAIKEIDGAVIESKKSKRKQKPQNIEDTSDEWDVIRGSFIHFACLTNAAMWDQSSGGGLSKYGHLSDGNIDLILVEKCSRKDFYRFIKRHTNSKNQLNLPFVKAIRVKEAVIKILNTQTSNNVLKSSHNSYDNHNIPARRSIADRIRQDFDNDSSESEFENNQENFDGTLRKSKTATNFESRIGSININNNNNNQEKGMFYIKPINKSSMTYSNKAFINDINDEIGDESNNNDNKNDMYDRKTMKKSQSMADFFKNNQNSSSKKSANDRTMTIKRESINLNDQNNNLLYQPVLSTVWPNNSFTTNKSFKKPSIWNCDWFLNDMSEFHIKCIRKFLPVFASGIDSATEFQEASVTACLPKI